MKKAIRTAYRSARNTGEGASSDAGRLTKAAGKLGMLVFKSDEKLSKQQEAAKLAIFDSTEALAQGLNKDVFKVVRSAAEIPTANNTNTALWPTPWHDKGQYANKWSALLASPGSRHPAELGNVLKPVSLPLGTVTVDSPDWSHNAVTFPVNSIMISAEAPSDDSGQTVDAPMTRVTINQQYLDPVHQLYEMDEDFTQELSFTIDASGKLGEVGLGRTTATGYTPEPNATVNAEQLFASVLEATQVTAAQYRDMGTIPDQLGM